MSRDDTFETVYPRYQFAPLVSLAISLGASLKRVIAIIRAARTRSQSRSGDAGLGHAA